MNHLNPDEILHAGHGWLDDPEDAIAQAHVESCEECAEAVRRVRAEREVLRAATVNSPIPDEEVTAMTAAILTMPQVRGAARPASWSPALGLTLAASILAVATGLVLFESNGGTPPFQDKPVAPLESEATRIRKLVRVFVGTDAQKRRDAKAALLKTGRPAIRILIEEQERLGDFKQRELFFRVSDLLFTLKFQGDTSPGSLSFSESIGSGRMEPSHSGPNIAIYELFDGWRVVHQDSLFSDRPAAELCRERLRYEIIDALLRQKDLDYAVRFGMVVVAPPEQLWPYPSMKSRPGDGAAVDQRIAELDADKPGKREAAELELLDMDDWIVERLRTSARDGSEEKKAALSRILDAFETRRASPLFENTCSVDRQVLTAVGSAWTKETLANPSDLVKNMEPFQRLRLDLAAKKISGWIAENPPKRTSSSVSCSELMADTRLADLRCYGEVATGPTTMRDILILLLRPAGLDFCVRDGAEPSIVVDTPEAIRALIEQQEKKK